MHWSTLVAFTAVNLAADLTPGPAVMFVIACAMRFGVRRAIAAIAGILSANAVYFALSATAMGVLLSASKLFGYVKWLGAAYLIYLGVRAWLVKPHAQEEARPTSHIFRDAFLTQISNPKAIVYFSALVPRFVDPAQPIATQMLVLGVASVSLEFCVLLGYAAAAGQGLRFARDPRYAVWLERISGVLLIAVAIALTLV